MRNLSRPELVRFRALLPGEFSLVPNGGGCSSLVNCCPSSAGKAASRASLRSLAHSWIPDSALQVCQQAGNWNQRSAARPVLVTQLVRGELSCASPRRKGRVRGGAPSTSESWHGTWPRAVPWAARGWKPGLGYGQSLQLFLVQRCQNTPVGFTASCDSQ